MKSAEQEIKEVITSYARSLSKSDPSVQASHFTRDGLMMADKQPTARGQEVLRKAFDGMVKEMVLKFELKFELMSLNEGYAVVVTTSAGKAELKSGGSFPIQNRAMWLMEKEDSAWKIGAYMYNTAGAVRS